MLIERNDQEEFETAFEIIEILLERYPESRLKTHLLKAVEKASFFTEKLLEQEKVRRFGLEIY